MELNSVRSFERLTGQAFFNDASDSTGDIPFGNIEMVKNSYTPKSVSIPLASRGNLTLARRDTFQVEPIFTIDGNQFHTALIPLLLLGDRGSDLAQTSATGTTFVFTAKKGRSYRIPYYNISSVVVTVSAAPKTLGTDYFLDDPNLTQTNASFNGIIFLPEVAAGIADGATVTVTFNKPVLAMEQYTAFTKLNRTGTLVIFAEDEFGPPAKEIWTMTVSLSVKDAADITPDKFRKFQLEASIFGKPAVQKRPT